MQAPPNRIRALRTNRALSLADVATHIGVHESTVSRWESGESGVPDWRKSELADFFNVSVPYLMGWDEPNGDNGDGVRQVA